MRDAVEIPGPDKTANSPGKSILAFVIVPVIIGLIYIIRVFLVKDCYAFESCDEVAPIFQGLGLVWRTLRAGYLPLFNFYENFGEPLIGDPFLTPFALHAISYLVFVPPLAATINRFIMISLTISLLTYVYHKHYPLSLSVASICATLLVALPLFNYFSVNHAHQGALLYFLIVIIMQRKFKIKSTFLNLTGLYLSLIIFSLSISNNAFFFGLPFLLLNQLFESNYKLDKNMMVFICLLIGILLLSFLHHYYFYSIAPLCVRYYSDYGATLPYTPIRLLTDLLFFYSQTPLMHVSACIYYSLPVIVLMAYGLFEIEDKNLLYKTLLLGLMPFVVVILLLMFVKLRSSIYVVKQFDIVRVLWFANVFLLAGIGCALESLRRKPKSLLKIAGIIFLLFFSIYGLNKSDYNPFSFLRLKSHTYIMLALIICFGAGMAIIKSKKNILFKLSIIILFLAVLPVIEFAVDIRAVGQAVLTHQAIPCHSYYFAPAAKAEFNPRKFLQDIEPYSRIAVQYEPYSRRYLQYETKHQIFGSDAKSHFSHNGLKEYLLKNRLIKMAYGNMIYYSDGNDLDQMSRLGIKYVITANTSGFKNTGWKLKNVALDENSECFENTFLYENPRDISLAYLNSGETVRYVHDLKFLGNNVTINLDDIKLKQEEELVLTFVDWPGWKATLDGRPTKIYSGPDHFLRIKIKPGDQKVEFSFVPFSKNQILLCILASLTLFFIAAIILRKSFPGNQ
jgi:hypothetical protein